MIINTTLFLGLIGLAFGQYNFQHQQFFYAPGNSVNQVARFDTKALTPVRQVGNQADKLKWTFASTYKRYPDGHDDSFEELYITELGDNLPNSAPFNIESVRRYFEPNQIFDIDVEDIILDDTNPNNTNNWHYIVCGSTVRKTNGKREGFIMKIRYNNGAVAMRRRYPEVFTFKSIVVSPDKKGYVAVGQYQKTKISSGGFVQDAVFVTVKKGNLNPICAQRTRGNFQGQGRPVYSRWNKIIQYRVPDFATNPGLTFYAVVGETEQVDPDLDNEDTYEDKECKKQGDVLVAMMSVEGQLDDNPTCSFVWDQKYGAEQFQGNNVQERGLSIAQYGVGEEEGWLVVTGNTKLPCNADLGFNDALAFRIEAKDILTSNGGTTVLWWHHFNMDVDQVSNASFVQFSFAIAIRSHNSWFLNYVTTICRSLMMLVLPCKYQLILL